MLLIEPLSNINRVLSLVLQNERLNGGSNDNTESQTFVIAAKTKKGSWKGKENSKTCTRCGKLAYIVDICYKKHEFPPNFKFKNGNYINNVYGKQESPKN